MLAAGPTTAAAGEAAAADGAATEAGAAKAAVLFAAATAQTGAGEDQSEPDAASKRDHCGSSKTSPEQGDVRGLDHTTS